MSNGDDAKAPFFGPEDAQLVELADRLRAVANKRASRQLAALSTPDVSAALTGVMRELVTNIQQLDESVSKLTTAMNKMNKRSLDSLATAGTRGAGE